EGALYTPPNSSELLPGITRDLVLELAQQAGLVSHEQPVGEDELRSADEIWITSSTRELYPVTRLDDANVASGKPGPLWARVHKQFQDFKQTYARTVEEAPS
ncbi:MAG: aminotransferase class IV, partial [Salinisphaeraceae bacterium]|nr:aminotransferase class IV [Salinisphaeraceae bacterium]